MRFGSSDDGFQRLDINMTAMIDVCFQMIIFFIVNMRIILPEGDFSVAMPVARPAASRAAPPGGRDRGLPAADKKDAAPAAELPTIKIYLLADKNGDLAGIQIGRRRLGSFKELRRQVRDLLATDRDRAGGAAGMEVEIDFDYNLKYESVIDAVTAISGYLTADKQVVRMIEKIKFVAPRRPR